LPSDGHDTGCATRRGQADRRSGDDRPDQPAERQRSDPELTFKHQVSFVDNRNIAAIGRAESTDGGVVQVQLADLAGNPVGDWLKIAAYENAYDSRGPTTSRTARSIRWTTATTRTTTSTRRIPCAVSGPPRRASRSSFRARAGHTDWRSTSILTNIGLAKDGPGPSGEPGAGFRIPARGCSRSSTFRVSPAVAFRWFLATSIELGSSQLWDELFAVDNVVGDDGWFIDDVRIEQALAAPITLAVDDASFAGLPARVHRATAALSASPSPPLSGPGRSSPFRPPARR
jgi:hypothetical protein